MASICWCCPVSLIHPVVRFLHNRPPQRQTKGQDEADGDGYWGWSEIWGLGLRHALLSMKGPLIFSVSDFLAERWQCEEGRAIAIKRSAKSRAELIRLATPSGGRALIMPSLSNSPSQPARLSASLVFSQCPGSLVLCYSGVLVSWTSFWPAQANCDCGRSEIGGGSSAGRTMGMRSAPRAFDFTVVPHNDHKRGSWRRNCWFDLQRALKRNK